MTDSLGWIQPLTRLGNQKWTAKARRGPGMGLPESESRRSGGDGGSLLAMAASGSTKQSGGKRTHHQFCPAPLPKTMVSASYVPAGRTSPPSDLAGKTAGPRTTRAPYGTWAADSAASTVSWIRRRCSRSQVRARAAFGMLRSRGANSASRRSRTASFADWSRRSFELATTCKRMSPSGTPDEPATVAWRKSEAPARNTPTTRSVRTKRMPTPQIIRCTCACD